MKKVFLSAVFAVAGTFAMAQKQLGMPSKWGEDHEKMMEQKRAQHLQEMQKDLGLTAAQMTALNAMETRNKARHEQQRLQAENLRKQRMQEMENNRMQMENDMRTILTPEQYKKWELKKQEKMQKRREETGRRLRPVQRIGVVRDPKTNQPYQK